MSTTFPVWPAASALTAGLSDRVRPYSRQYVRHQRIREAFTPRTLAGVPNNQSAVGYTQSNRRPAQQARLGSLSTHYRGMGEDETTQQIAMSAAQIAGTAGAAIVGVVGTTAGTAATATTAATAATMATWAAVAIPLIGAAVVGVTIWLSMMFKKNAQKEAATDIVDQIEKQLQANLAGYQSGPRTPASQLQALANFDAGWQAVLENCGNPQLGSAGERCISERQQGGSAPWCPKPGGRGCDWFALYRDPIAQDIPVQTLNTTGGGTGTAAVPGSIEAVVETLTTGGVQVGETKIPYLLIAGVFVLLMATKGGSK